MSNGFFDGIEAEDLDLYGIGEYFDDGEGEYFDDSEGEYFDDGEADYLDDGEGEYIDDEGEVYAEEDYFGAEPELAEARYPRGYRRRLAMMRAARARAARARALAARRRRYYRPRPRPRPKPRRRPSYPSAPSRRPVSTTQARKAFNRVDTKLQRTQAAIQNVDLDNKVQSDMTARALVAQRKRIDRNEYAQAASKVVDELQERFPELKSNEVIRTALPLAPLLFLKPHKKGTGFESVVRDPRVWGPVLAAGAALFSETRDKDQTPQEVTITPETFTLRAAGATINLQAVARDRNRRIISPQPSITFATSDPAVATVDANTGAVTAVAAGTVLITATVTGTNVRGVATVTVEIPDQTPVDVTITPGTFTLPAAGGGTAGLQAVARNITGGVISPQPAITFVSSNPAVATVDANTGVVTAVAAGTVLITATVTGTNVRNVATVAVT